MASKYYTGSAATSVAQVDRFTPATVQIGDIFTLTATGEDGSTAAVTFTATVATVANVTAGLVAAWNASTNPLHTPITAADATTSMTLTADTAGVPFSVAATTTDGGGANTQTLTRAAVTVNVGPNDWGTALNWSDFIVPITGDTVTTDGRAEAAILYGLNQSAVTLASFQHYESMRYDVGTSVAPLRISATICDLARPAVDGSRNTPGAVYLDTGSNATTLTNWGGARNGSGGLPPVCVKGAHASNILRVYAGGVGVAVQKPGDTANFPIVSAYNDQTAVVLGSGCSTVTTLTGRSANIVTYAASSDIDRGRRHRADRGVRDGDHVGMQRRGGD
jgi:hypothetical protein